MKIVSTVKALRNEIVSWRAQDARVGLVPTMGALHQGHLSLVEAARRHADRVVVSIFVNPKQFAPHEDFDRYPRELATDTKKLEQAAADLVFAPETSELYPNGFATIIDVGGPGAGLETDFRPHFFKGVATVVSKLLIAALADIAVFGEKDYQQLLVVRRVARDLGIPTDIVGAPIVREEDGLAMSSRNAYLSPEERRIAGALNVILKRAIAQVQAGNSLASIEASAVEALRDRGFDAVDYVAIRDAEDLRVISSVERPGRILAAVRIGRTRLIDNMAIQTTTGQAP